METVARIMRDPSCWPFVRDDRTPADWVPEDDASIYYLLVIDEEEIAGLVIIEEQNGVMGQLHIAFLAGHRGKIAVEGIRDVFAWVWQHTPYRKLIGLLPRWNMQARVLARNVGMRREGCLRKAHLRRGKYHDLMIYGTEAPG